MLCAALLLALVQSSGFTAEPAAAEDLPLAASLDWARDPDRRWLGRDLWGNRLQDWRVRDEALECVGPSNLRWRTAILAGVRTRAADARRLEVTLAPASEDLAPDAWAGFLIGAGGAGIEDGVHPLHGLLVQGTVGRGFGWFAGISASGRLAIQKLDSPDAVAELDRIAKEVGIRPLDPRGVRLVLSVERDADGPFELGLEALDPASGVRLARTTVAVVEGEGLPDAGLRGQIGLVADPGPSKRGPGAAFRFDDLDVYGEAEATAYSDGVGPLVSTLYTVDDGVLKVTAQFLPLGDAQIGPARLFFRQDNGRFRTESVPIRRDSWTATFRVEGWNSSVERLVNVSVTLPGFDGERFERRPGEFQFGGNDGTRPRSGGMSFSVPVEPAPDAPLELALLNCCHQISHDLVGGWGASGGIDRGDWRTGSWFPHADLVANVAAREPDLYAFVGDQVYEGASPTGVDRANLELDYLYKWLIWCLAFRDLTSTRPTVVLPDDHDVYQGNIWGEGGIAAEKQQSGGYQHPAEFVAMVEATQTAHLPDTAHPGGVIAQGLPARYGELIWGGVSFAIVEDRKFKNGCLDERMPKTDTNRPDHWAVPPEDRSLLDPEGLQLLGEEQEAFLAEWATADRGGRMRAAISQTPFAGLATHHGKGLQRLIVDLDSNGWPRSGRDRAVELLRRAGAVHLAGDQHLATLVQHGLAEHGDAVFDFTGPSIANFYPRAWWPTLGGDGRPDEIPGPEAYTGEFADGLGNRVTVHAAANPMPDDALRGLAGRDLEPMALHRGMPGFGLVRFDPPSRRVTFECWPRFAGLDDPQYPGWPVTVEVQEDGSQSRVDG